MTNVQISGYDPKAKGQAQQIQQQAATPTLVGSSVESTAQAKSTSAAVSTSVLVVALPQATNSPTLEAKQGAAQGNQQTSSATSLRGPLPMGMVKGMRNWLLRGGLRQSVMSM